MRTMTHAEWKLAENVLHIAVRVKLETDVPRENAK